MLNSIKCNLVQFWYRPTLRSGYFYGLAPLAFIYYGLIQLRRVLYHLRLRKPYHFSVPVVVVGNITMGGTGKTPLTVALANHLKSQGCHPGLVSRGYGGRVSTPTVVTKDSRPELVGDEAVLLMRQTQCPVVVSHNRVAAVKHLLKLNPQCDVVLSDDGLQHYRLGRAFEVAVMVLQKNGQGDKYALFGNGFLFPLGPLREGRARLEQVNWVVVNGVKTVEECNRLQKTVLTNGLRAIKNIYPMTLHKTCFYHLRTGAIRYHVDEFENKTIHALAGIGQPWQFFDTLNQLGFSVLSQRIFPDHHLFLAKDIQVGTSNDVVIMTEKDAVKCMGFADERHWCLCVTAKLEPGFLKVLTESVMGWKPIQVFRT